MEQEGYGGGEAGGGREWTTQYVRANCKSFKATNLTVVEGGHYFISPGDLPGMVYYSSRFDVRCGIQHNFWCGIQRVIASWCVTVHASQHRTFQSIGATM